MNTSPITTDKHNNFIAGFSLATGTTLSYYLADAGAMFFMWRRAKQGYLFSHNGWVYGFALLIGMTVIWSPDKFLPLWTAFRIVIIFNMVRNTDRDSSFWFGLGIPLAVKMIAGLVQLTYFPDHSRADGWHFNASSYGQSGFMLAAGPFGWLGAIILGMSMARIPMLALALLGFLRWNRQGFIYGGVTLVVVLMMTTNFGNERFSVSSVEVAIDRQRQTLEGIGSAKISSTSVCGPIREREWQLLGYGYHGYCASTGLQRPHNVFVLSWWELGILAVPFWWFVVFGLASIRSRLVVALFPLIWFAEDLYSRPEGLWMIAGFLMIHGLVTRSPNRLHTIREKSMIEFKDAGKFPALVNEVRYDG